VDTRLEVDQNLALTGRLGTVMADGGMRAFVTVIARQDRQTQSSAVRLIVDINEREVVRDAAIGISSTN
jgi:hypothetical protein